MKRSFRYKFSCIFLLIACLFSNTGLGKPLVSAYLDEEFIKKVPIYAKETSLDLLGSELTPLGAIRRGSKNGITPSWEGDQRSIKEHNKLLDEFARDLPIFTITHHNLSQYQHLLSEGMVKLFEAYPDTFSVPVYPSRRTAKIPDWLYKNAIKNGTEAKISSDGEEVLYAWPGLPFPIPTSAKEVMWNHQLRWKGVFFKFKTLESVVTRTGAFSLIENNLEVYSVYHNQGRARTISDWRYIYYLSYINAPARIAGGAYLSHESMLPKTKPRQSWMYVAGQRRMRRSPVMGYDAPTFTSDGLRMMDEIDMYNGAMDRYDWTLVGKRFLIIPYNNHRLQDEFENEKKILTRSHINPEALRYELHRVWVVDAKVKKGQRHLYDRRTFYIDEDSWSVVLVDIYDKMGNLWRTSQRFSAYYRDIPAMATSLDAFHDLIKGTYYIQGVRFEKSQHFYQAPPKGYFTPVSVRQRIHR